MQPIYLDYNATTPVDPAVAEAMQPYMLHHYGNPSSTHAYGRATKEAVENARARVAALLGCAAPEVVFTSGGSESNNTVLKGVAYTYRHRGHHIITSAIEHPATINPCRFLEQQGLRVTYLPVDRTGMVDPDDVRKAITPQTLLISIMHANNEVGTLQPIAEISRIARAHGVLHAYGRSAVRRQNPHAGGRAGGRFSVYCWSQSLCSQGYWSALHAHGLPARTADPRCRA